ncbi:MAG: acetyltransferase, partial [Kiritimatiellae bacterium]|nr:acetyltransferase [Kiritimatiellia bacterium]
MRNLFIVGAGGFGREAVWTVERINAAQQQPVWNVIGFADDDPAKAFGNFEGYPLLGSVEKASKDHPGASVFIAVGDNAVRRKIYRQLRGHDFPALIDPSSQVSPTTEFKHGTFIACEAVVSVGTEIGKFVIINARAGVGHDSTVGDFANIAPGVSLSGHTVIGEDVMMGTNSCTAPGMTVGAGATVVCGTPVLK